MKKTTLSLLLLLTLQSTAGFAESESSVEISADTVEIQEGTGMSIYQGNAKLVQGKDRITADKISISHPDQAIKSIFVQGSAKKPAAILFFLKNGDKVEGSAVSIHYDIETEILTFKQNVNIQQGKNKVQAQSIVFNKKKQSLTAKSSKRQRVITTFEIPK